MSEEKLEGFHLFCVWWLIVGITANVAALIVSAFTAVDGWLNIGIVGMLIPAILIVIQHKKY